MDKEEAEQIAKSYGEFVEKKTLEFLLKEPVEKLEIIRNNLPFYSPMSAFIQDVLDHWKELKATSFITIDGWLPKIIFGIEQNLGFLMAFRRFFALVCWKFC